MFATLSALAAWFLGGSILRTIAAASLGGAIGFGSGFLFGYSTADKAAAVDALKTQVAILEAEVEAWRKLDELSAILENDRIAAEAENERIEKDLERHVKAVLPPGVCVGGAFLDGLRKLK